MPAAITHSLDAAASPDSTEAARLAAHREIERLRAELAAERAARQQIQRDLDLRNAALDAAKTMFMIVDAQHPRRPILYVNRAVAMLHGYERADLLIGESMYSLAGRNVTEEERAPMREKLLAGQTVSFEDVVTRPDGTQIEVGVTATPLRNAEGVTTHYVALGADITARRENERRRQELQEQLYAEMRERERMAIELRLAQKLESVGRLAAGLAHEINTPIQYVSDSVHFLRSAFDDLKVLFDAYRAMLATLAQMPEQQSQIARLTELESASDLEFLAQEVPKAFERTLEGADRVAGIVRAMKEFAYPDAVEHSPADLNHALQTTLTVARGEYKYAATVETDLGELPLVVCNVGELNQVFLNLIVNAAHAIDDSGKDAANGRIRIATRAVEDAAEIVIADNGCGITQENVEKIFDPFFTTKEVGRGTGQGLAIARAIVVEKHRGSIDVESTPGQGTRFIVRLPVSAQKGEQA